MLFSSPPTRGGSVPEIGFKGAWAKRRAAAHARERGQGNLWEYGEYHLPSLLVHRLLVIVWQSMASRRASMRRKQISCRITLEFASYDCIQHRIGYCISRCGFGKPTTIVLVFLCISPHETMVRMRYSHILRPCAKQKPMKEFVHQCSIFAYVNAIPARSAVLSNASKDAGTPRKQRVEQRGH